MRLVSPLLSPQHAVRRAVERHGSRLRLHGRKSNEDVLALLRDAHVLLLPALAETYGYAVLEAQACACAVVSTNVRALPELNGPDHGWVIDLALQRGRSAQLSSAADLSDAEDRIEAGVLLAIESMLAAPGNVLQKGASGWERIRAHHDPARAAARLSQLYKDAAVSRTGA